MTKRILKLIMATLAVAFVFTACSPNPGGNENNDKNKFEMPSYMVREKLGNYTLYMYDEITEKDIEAGSMSITAEDITINLDLGGTDVKFFGGSTDSLKEFYEMAWNVDKDSVMISGGDGRDSNILFRIANSSYTFSWDENNLHNGMGTFRSIGGGASTTYYMQPAN